MLNAHVDKAYNKKYLIRPLKKKTKEIYVLRFFKHNTL